MKKLSHPCRGNCSGWDQGFDAGHTEVMEKKVGPLREALLRVRGKTSEALREAADNDLECVLFELDDLVGKALKASEE